MPVANGIYTPLTFDAALTEIIAAAPSSIQFSPGNPAELVLANMFAQAFVLVDENNGETMAAIMSPVGSMLDLMNPNNPRKPDISATGYVNISNSSLNPITLPLGTVLTASTGSTYSIGSIPVTVPGSGNKDVIITAINKGSIGNIAAGITFSIPGLTTLTITNPLPILSGANAESDALYLNRLTSEKTEYGTQNGSVAVETELKKYYADAKMYVNNSHNELTFPVPVPANGYNLIVKIPSDTLAAAPEIAQIFTILSQRLEFVNAMNVGSTLHKIFSGTVYTTRIPQSYYFTVAQSVKTTLDAVINVRVSKNADRSEIITQANNFALLFINRYMRLLSGVNGDTTVTFKQTGFSDVETVLAITGSPGIESIIAPSFSIAVINGLVNDIDTMSNNPLVVYDSTASMTVELDPQDVGEYAVTLDISGPPQYIDFENDVNFSDGSSWYDRYVFVDPANIHLTIQVSAWI